jgi:hypothetical protein
LPEPVTPVSRVVEKSRRSTAARSAVAAMACSGPRAGAGMRRVRRVEGGEARQQSGFDQPGIGHAAQDGRADGGGFRDLPAGAGAGPGKDIEHALPGRG